MGYFDVVCLILVTAFADGTDVSSEERLQRLMELPPSAKLVYKTLEYEGPLTQAALAEASKLSTRTIRTAIDELDAADVVREEVYIPDARQRLYRLKPIGETEG